MHQMCNIFLRSGLYKSFLRVSCLNFNHVIIMKEFHNVFAYYAKSKPNKFNYKETTLFDLI
jgi:hypothetical protein